MKTKELIKIAFKRVRFITWFNVYFWIYLLEKGTNRNYCSKWHRFWCRAANHPCGVWWYSAGGHEPDMTCKECGDDLG